MDRGTPTLLTMGELASLRQSISSFTTAAELDAMLRHDPRIGSFVVRHQSRITLVDRSEFYERLTRGTALGLMIRRRRTLGAMFGSDFCDDAPHHASDLALDVGLGLMANAGVSAASDLLVRFESGRFGTVPVVAVLEVVAAAHAAQHEAVVQSESRLRALLRSTSDAIIVADAQNRIVYASPAYETLTGVAAADAIGTGGYDRIHRDDIDAFAAAVERSIANPHASLHCEVRVQHTNGRWLWCLIKGQPMFDDPSIGGFVVNISDITESRHLREGLRHQAEHDGLTGLANRHVFFDRLRQMQAGPTKQKRSGSRSEPIPKIGIVYFDLDGFKDINDSLGHAAGDVVLTEVAQRLRPLLRTGDLLARLGGDEFAALVAVDDDAALGRVASRLSEALQQPVLVGDRYISIAASFGVASALPAQVEGTELVRRADAAMYAAKRQGRNCIAEWSDELPEEATAAQERARLLRTRSLGG